MDKNLKVLKADQDRIFSSASAVMSALSSPVRLQLLHFLSQAPQSVEVLATKLNQSVANTSMHLRKMQSEKLLKVTSQGQKRIYALAHNSLYEFWEQLQDFVQARDPEMKLNTSLIGNDLDWIKSLVETRKELEKGKIILLDVRPAEEVEEDQLEGMKNYLHIPSSEILSSLKKIPKSKEILVMCRGRLCALSAYSVKQLRDNGYKAYRFKHSWFSIANNILQKEAI